MTIEKELDMSTLHWNQKMIDTAKDDSKEKSTSRTSQTYLAMALFSTAMTTQSFPWIPTTVDPLRTASIEYSTCNKCPSGLNTVMARSYDMVNLFQLDCFFLFVYF